MKAVIQWAIALIMVSLFAAIGFAQGVVIVEPTQAEWGQWLTSAMQGPKGLALALVLVQGIMLMLRGQLGEKAGKWRYLAVALVSLVVAILGVLVSGQPWSALVNDAATIAAFSVFLHQALLQFGTAKGNQV